MTIVGAHSVGGVDGGPGVPVTGWSREHGDVRVPHFIGLHAIQALALVAPWPAALARARGRPRQGRAGAAASYASLFLLLLWRALRGQSVVAPDAAWLAIDRDLGGGHRAGPWLGRAARVAPSRDGLDRMAA